MTLFNWFVVRWDPGRGGDFGFLGDFGFSFLIAALFSPGERLMTNRKLFGLFLPSRATIPTALPAFSLAALAAAASVGTPPRERPALLLRGMTLTFEEVGSLGIRLNTSRSDVLSQGRLKWAASSSVYLELSPSS